MGVPQFFGIYYAMGAALISEGFMSACYHFCPDDANFQFGRFSYIANYMSLYYYFVTHFAFCFHRHCFHVHHWWSADNKVASK